jgi:Flp pilus assembly protein TadD
MARLKRSFRPSALRGLAGLTTTLMLGACAQTGDLLPTNMLASTEPEETLAANKSESGLNELQKATAYWGQRYAKDPLVAESALAYAKNLKALGEKEKALSVLQRSFALHNDNREIAGEYGRLALELGQVGAADKLLAFAEDPAKPDWRIISARGTVLAKKGEYKAAIPFYERALLLSPNESSVLNNLAMASAMSGEPKKAEELLRKAEALPSADPGKIRQNLALVLGLQGRYDEAKSVTAGMPGSQTTAENVALVRDIVKLPQQVTSVPAVAANTGPADFKAQVNTALANASDPTPHPDLKPATIDTASSPLPWETSVASAAATGR